MTPFEYEVATARKNRLDEETVRAAGLANDALNTWRIRERQSMVLDWERSELVKALNEHTRQAFNALNGTSL